MTTEPRTSLDDTPQGPVPASYMERLSPPPLWHLVSVLTGVTAGMVVVPLTTPLVCVAVGVVVAVLTSAALVATAPVLQVHDGIFRAGEARIDLTLLGRADVLDAQATRRALGPELDARAFVVLRAWCHTAIRVPVEDPADPTPYWLVSTRQPELLAAAVNGADNQRGQV